MPVLALAALALAGTPLPFWLFAFGQARVPAELAGAFLNLEPVVGAAAGWLALGEPAGAWQIMGVVAVLAGVAMSTLPPRAGRRAGSPSWLASLTNFLPCDREAGDWCPLYRAPDQRRPR